MEPTRVSHDIRLPTVWHERYHCPEAGGLPSTVKQKAVVEGATILGLVTNMPDRQYDARKTWASIAEVHSADYVNAVRYGEPRRLAQSQGFHWCPELSESLCRIWSGHIHACRLALERGVAFHPVSGAHHARRVSGGAFCTFNYLVGAAVALLSQGLRRVMIVDLDTHQGNGTWELAGDRNDIAIFDLSGVEFNVPETDWETRFAQIARSVDEYFELLGSLPDAIDALQPDLIQYQAGMDCHERDPLGGIKGMTDEQLLLRDAFVFESAFACGVPVVFNLAGGYQSDLTNKLHLGTVRMAVRSREKSRLHRANRRGLDGARDVEP